MKNTMMSMEKKRAKMITVMKMMTMMMKTTPRLEKEGHKATTEHPLTKDKDERYSNQTNFIKTIKKSDSTCK